VELDDHRGTRARDERGCRLERALGDDRVGAERAHLALDPCRKREPEQRPVEHRARAQAELGNWSEAAKDFNKAIELGSDGDWPEQAAAKTVLALGDTAAYRRSCADLLLRYGKTENPQLANEIAWMCGLVPDATADLPGVVRLAERAILLGHTNADYFATFGAVLYRSGRHRDAVLQLNNAIKERGTDGLTTDWLLLAMAHHQMGQKEQSARWLDKATSWLNLPPESKTSPETHLSWEQQLEIKVLFDEANKLIGGLPGLL